MLMRRNNLVGILQPRTFVSLIHNNNKTFLTMTAQERNMAINKNSFFILWMSGGFCDIPFIPTVCYASRDEAQADIDYEIKNYPHKVGVVITQNDIKMMFNANR